ncbi:unnamed protein product, partial [Meganyctiphanes norvegica]
NSISLFVFELFLILSKGHKGDTLGIHSLQDEKEINHQQESTGDVAIVDNRKGNEKAFLFVRIRPDTCSSTNSTSLNLKGTCQEAGDCALQGGTHAGTCAEGVGTCCVAQHTCGDYTRLKQTYFVNPGHPKHDKSQGTCVYTVNRHDSTMCQIKLDMMKMSLTQPDERSGVCIQDVFQVLGGKGGETPPVCGDNDGQHMYIDFPAGGGPIKLSLDRVFSSSKRFWNIQVTQIPCNSHLKAPSGCLQYYTDTMGTVSSFNFDPQHAPPYSSRQLSSQDYSVCVATGENHCSIEWEPQVENTRNSFLMSYNLNALDPKVLGNLKTGSRQCKTDYISIPGAHGSDSIGMVGDRLCGLAFPHKVISSSRPFMLYVKTDDNEEEDGGNSGFRLSYRQMPC